MSITATLQKYDIYTFIYKLTYIHIYICKSTIICCKVINKSLAKKNCGKKICMSRQKGICVAMCARTYIDIYIYYLYELMVVLLLQIFTSSYLLWQADERDSRNTTSHLHIYVYLNIWESVCVFVTGKHLIDCCRDGWLSAVAVLQLHVRRSTCFSRYIYVVRRKRSHNKCMATKINLIYFPFHFFYEKNIKIGWVNLFIYFSILFLICNI